MSYQNLKLVYFFYEDLISPHRIRKMVMTKKILKSIELEIEKCKKQLRELEPLIYKNAGVAESYNRLLVKKAILVDKYKKALFKKPVVSKIASFFKFKKEPKLICDYFPNA